ncbi:M61 family metallopeptidase [Sphingomonas jatrophae]|uniref:Glycyl aminopeptidase. Metallo peptidase. MEROPS family M61 n=1 Tax=Sphingomonas jatrophae TaxID=1166337 RepID=A0A1I6LRW2_9SPHN|nr:M61 family metallopeptidase [Sphingomonas jatrophae]SFS06184.1 glycyl aminopeptidase. Metallo peptidase. MEROPS family M61 [Sphingomonas jatrophae]
MITRFAAVAALLLATAAPATPPPGNSLPQPVLPTDTIPAPKDVPYPGGTMRLDVDATDTARGIFRVKQSIPVAADAGHMVLLYPEWLQGNHAPRGAISQLAGVKFSAGGRPLTWSRDPVDVYAFHLDVPAGAKAIEAEFQFLSPTRSDQGRVVMTPAMLNLQWNAVALYPAGWFTRRIDVQADVTYPKGWVAATALKGSKSGDTVRYETVDFDTLLDSPVFAGRNYRGEQLAPGVRLNIFADRPGQLAATQPQIDKHKALVTQAVKLFGAQHYDRYEFLFALSDMQSGIGLEHHRSSENGVGPDYFTDWDGAAGDRDLLPHEYTHSWNGKFRRGADLWTPDYRTPMRNSLLWVYEGQTQFWGTILAARSGLLSRDEALGSLAYDAAVYDTRAGRTWRPVVDTTNDPIMSARRPKGWTSWQRSEDYYVEGMLVWIEADSIIRQRSGGRRSLDDFARAFFGLRDRDWGEVTYTVEDVAAELNKVQPYDWGTFLKTRIYDVRPTGVLQGFTNGGYKLVYTDTPTGYLKAIEKASKGTNLSFSGGLTLNGEGTITGVMWDSPAFAAGLSVGQKIVGIDGMTWSAETLKDAIRAAATSKAPIPLTVQSGDRLRTVQLNYTGGLRYPRLERSTSGASTLDALLTPLK